MDTSRYRTPEYGRVRAKRSSMESKVTKKPSKKGGGKLKKTMTAEEEARRREEIKENLREKLELEKRALQVVERLLDDFVAEHFLVDCARFITAANYKDAVEERSIARLCGYPVCSNKLGKIPNQQYMISTKTNKVYDITERKCFCSNFCCKASKEFELQISKTPLWLRQHESPEEIKLLNKGSSGSSGQEVLLKERGVKNVDVENPSSVHLEEPTSSQQRAAAGDDLGTSDISEDEQEQDFVSSVIPHQKQRVHWDELPKRTDEDLKGQQEENERSKKKTKETPRGQVSKSGAEFVSDSGQTGIAPVNSGQTVTSAAAPPTQNTHQSGLVITQVSVSRRGAAGLRDLLQKQSVQDNVLQYLSTTLKDWCTPDTRVFLHGAAPSPSSTHAVEEEELDEDDLDVTVVASKNVKETKRTTAAAPDYQSLKREAEQQELRVQEFYKGTGIGPEDEDGHQGRRHDGSARVSSLPLLDSTAQHLIQKRIAVDKLNSCLRNLVGPLRLTMSDVSSHLNNLVRTFRLTNKNIIHKSPEWTLIAVVLLHVLSDVSPVVREALEASTSVQYLKTLMEELGLQQHRLLNLVQLFKWPTH